MMYLTSVIFNVFIFRSALHFFVDYNDIMDLRYPNALSTFLQIDPLGQYDEYVMRKQL